MKVPTFVVYIICCVYLSALGAPKFGHDGFPRESFEVEAHRRADGSWCQRRKRSAHISWCRGTLEKVQSSGVYACGIPCNTDHNASAFLSLVTFSGTPDASVFLKCLFRILQLLTRSKITLPSFGNSITTGAR